MHDYSLGRTDDAPFILSEKEVHETQELLRTAKDPSEFSEQMEGGIVLDGIVSSVQRSRDHSIVVEFLISNILSGEWDVNAPIRIWSPPSDKGGAEFKSGKNYRVFAVPSNDKAIPYLTWRGLSIEL